VHSREGRNRWCVATNNAAKPWGRKEERKDERKNNQTNKRTKGTNEGGLVEEVYMLEHCGGLGGC
jgi:hypothetical protein